MDFNYLATALIILLSFSRFGQISVIKWSLISIVHSQSPLNCWLLFYCVAFLSQEPLLFHPSCSLPPPLPLNKHPFLKANRISALHFLFDFPHIAVNCSPNTDGRQACTLPLVAFSLDLFSVNIVIYMRSRNCFV